MKNQLVMYHKDALAEDNNQGCVKRVLTYCDDLMIVENDFQTGAEGAPHSHPHAQTAYIVSGKFEFTIGDEKYTVSAGDSLYMPGDVIHGCVCLEAGKLVDSFAPYRADFVKD